LWDFLVVLRGGGGGTPGGGGGGCGSKSPIKSLNRIQEVQRGQEVPPDGGRVLPTNVQMTPFRPKGLINSSLSARLPGGPEGVDGLLSLTVITKH